MYCNSELALPTVADNCGVVSNQYNIPSGSVFSVGVNVIAGIAQEANGNTASCGLVITVKDGENPQLTCPGPISVSTDLLSCDAVVNYALPTATDNYGVDTNQYDTHSGTKFSKGVSTVTGTATDSAGNSANCASTVTVTDAEVLT